jgi:hypothetical protein
MTRERLVLKDERVKKVGRKARQVRCSELDVIFPTMTAAADFAGCTQGHMLQIIRNKSEYDSYHYHYWYDEIHAEKFDEWVAEKKRIRGVKND